ncbi:MAG TPA: Dabb family protein [Vicinamibacterales bacterium]|nr:Dabb family protein [Vicinamibacterales bacterium]
MLMHLVCFKYRTDVIEARRDEHCDRLTGLHDIPGIVSLVVGRDVVQSARSYDTGLAIQFTDRAALDAYQKNPRHVPVAQFGAGLCEHIVAVDFEI